MMSKPVPELELIYQRRSVRNFQTDPVPDAVIEQLIDAAVHAPSGKNRQNWHFVVVRNPELIQQMAAAVEAKHAALLPFFADDAKRQAFKGTVAYHTVFKNAPAVVLVYAGPYPVPADDLKPGDGLSEQDIQALKFANPGIQNVAAALQNLHLAATALGYGTCWMTGPTYASREITAIVGFHKEGFSLAAVSPLGIPAGTGGSPPRRPVAEALTVID